MKKFFLVPLLLIYINCSSAAINTTIENRTLLGETIAELKETAVNNQYEELEKYFLPTFKNKIVLNYLKQYDFSKINIIVSEPSFEKNGRAKNVMIMNYASESMYFNITWKFVDNEWKILNVAERK
jgi:hypothetical protein